MKVTNVFCVLLISLVNTYQVKSQITINGTITDNQSNPIPDAFVEFFNPSDTMLVYSDYTNNNGAYWITGNFVGINNEDYNIPNDHVVLRNYPNPFNPSTVIYFEIPEAEKIEIKIYDVLGKEVRSLTNNYHKAGIYQINWDGRNNFGSGVASGIYLCRLKTNRHSYVHKMVLIDGGGGISKSGNGLFTSSALQKMQTAAELHQFRMRVSGNSIATREIDSLFCSQDTTINVQVSKIKTQTIGAEGGTVATTGFELTVPLGAFVSDYSISVHQAYVENSFGDFGVSKVYNLSGLPPSTAAPLKLKIKYEGVLSNMTYITIGEDSYQPELGENNIVYQFFESSDSSGFVIAEIDLISEDSTLSLAKVGEIQSGTNRTISVATDYIPEIIDDRISIKSPYSYLEIITGHINIAIENFNSLGFNQLGQYFKWIDFEVIPFEVNGPGLVAFPAATISNIYDDTKLIILIDLNRINNPLLPAQIHSSLFASIQGKYSIFELIKRGDENNIDRGKNLWLHTAMNSWAGTISGIYPPLSFFLNVRAPFYSVGLTPQTDDFAWHMDFGYGMSSLIFYLDDQNLSNGDFVINTYKYIEEKKPLYHITGLINSLEQPVFQWYPAYINAYITDQVFSFDFSELFEISRGEWTIADKNDTLHVFDNESAITFSDISTKLYRINCNYPEISDKAELLFTTTSDDVNVSNRRLFIYEYTNNKFVQISSSDGSSFAITNIKSLFEQQKTLYCAVINSKFNEPNFDGQSEIYLKVALKDQQWATPYCLIESNMYFTFFQGSTEETTYRYWGPVFSAMGTIDNSENTFESSWDKENSNTGVKEKGQVCIEYDSLTTALKLVDAHLRLDQTTYDSIAQVTEIWSSDRTLKAFDLPLLEVTDNSIVYGVIGTTTNEFITQAVLKDSSETINHSAGWSRSDWRETRGYTADENSYLKVTFGIY